MPHVTTDDGRFHIGQRSVTDLVQTKAAGRECEFANAGSCHPAAGCRHRQQPVAFLT